MHKIGRSISWFFEGFFVVFCFRIEAQSIGSNLNRSFFICLKYAIYDLIDYGMDRAIIIIIIIITHKLTKFNQVENIQ